MTNALKILHQPVLLDESLHFINVKRDNTYLDVTLGSGGHAIEIAKQGGYVIGLDQDQTAIERVKTRIKILHVDLLNHIRFVHGNFRDLEIIVSRMNIHHVAGVLFDLGLSQEQLKQDARGFSFESMDELDMRMDQDEKVKAVDLINGLERKELVALFRKYGEVYKPQLVVDAIIRRRMRSNIVTAHELSNLILNTYGRKWERKIHPATQVFQALRIAVNDELNNLSLGLEQAEKILMPEGRLVVISYHSIEDRIVKNFMRAQEGIKIITKKPIVPQENEIRMNPSSRSAKLRCGEKYANKFTN